MVLPRLFAPDVLPVVTVSEASLGTVQQVVENRYTYRIRTYFSPVSATVESFGLQVGDTVEAGETLLTYDAAELDELYRQAELTGSAAAYGYQDSIGKDNENVAEYNRSTAALEIIDRQLDEEDDNLDHLNDRVREYTGYQGDSSAKLASLKEQQAQAQAAIADLKEKQAALEAAQKALEAYKALWLGRPEEPERMHRKPRRQKTAGRQAALRQTARPEAMRLPQSWQSMRQPSQWHRMQ